MQFHHLSLHRSRQFLGNAVARALPLAVFFDGQRLGTLETGETRVFSLPERPGLLQVGMSKGDLGLGAARGGRPGDVADCVLSGPGQAWAPGGAVRHLETGTFPWVALDFMGLCYLPWFDRRVFYLRPAAAPAGG